MVTLRKAQVTNYTVEKRGEKMGNFHLFCSYEDCLLPSGQNECDFKLISVSATPSALTRHKCDQMFFFYLDGLLCCISMNRFSFKEL